MMLIVGIAAGAALSAGGFLSESVAVARLGLGLALVCAIAVGLLSLFAQPHA
jgi:hypothetical protein